MPSAGFKIMKQIHLAIFMTLSTLVIVGCSSTALSDKMTAAERESLENIYSVDIKADSISFIVKSHGCTSKDDFELIHQIHKGTNEFALKRLKRDLCRAMPRAYPVSFKLPQTGLTIDKVNVLNPLYEQAPPKRGEKKLHKPD